MKLILIMLTVLVSGGLIIHLWVRHPVDTVLKRLIWSVVLLLPFVGWILYGAFYSPPPVQPKDMRAKDTLGIG
jgi:hypothetical protein